MAHLDAWTGDEEVESGGVCVRVGGNEGGSGPGLAGGDTARGSEQEVDKRAEWVRDGSVQVQKRVHHVLCLCGETSWESRVLVC